MRGTIPFLAGTPVGHYRIAAVTGLTAGIAANGAVFSMRWANTTYVRPLILRMRLQAAVVTPYTGLQEFAAAAFIARSFTAADTGGTALTLTGTNNVQNSLSDIPTAATINVSAAAALTVGTRTLDANPFLYLPGAQGIAAGASAAVSNEFTLYSSDSQFPFNLQSAQVAAASAEGIVVQVPIAQGAGGTTRICVEVDWIEYGYGPGTVPGAIA